MTNNGERETPIIIEDLRSKLPVIRDQGRRPLCLVFASSDANSHANGLCDPLSIEYLAYYAYKLSGKKNYSKGLCVHEVCQALSKEGQPEENIYPYNMTAKSITKPCEKNILGNDIYYGEFMSSSRKYDNVEKTINNGIPVLICSHVTVDMLSGKSPAIYSESKDVRGNHAMIVCGIGESKGKRLLMIKNSWGRSWANGGYAWITDDYVKRHVFNAQVMETK